MDGDTPPASPRPADPGPSSDPSHSDADSAPASKPREAPAAAAGRLRSLALHERPQERLERLGPAALSDTELLAMILRSGTAGRDVLAVAEHLLNTAGSLAGLVGWTKAEFRRVKGLGHVKSLQLVTVLEIARRIVTQQAGESPLLDRPELIAAYMAPLAQGIDVEKFWVLCLNRRNRLLRCVEITSGTATATLAHPREVFRTAIREGASAVAVVHNHPSGDPTPSSADMRITRTLREASKAVDIELTDHVIVGTAANDPLHLGHYSFKAGGFL